MAKQILVLNSGSSSLKYELFAMEGEGRSLATGLIERIGEPSENNGSAPADHHAAVDQVVSHLARSGHLSSANALWGIGHRVVHGGETFRGPALIDDAVVAAIREAVPLAPLHNPPNLAGIEVCRARWPEVPQVAVFDTAFHQTMPPHSYRYALPEACYRDFRIRRYGFHGASLAYITRRVAEHLGRAVEDLNLIVLHLGNGASISAIEAGRSIDTSMGMTPLSGLMMGTRCGDLDPGVILYLLEQLGRPLAEVSAMLSRASGLKGVAGSNDMRDVLARAEAGDPEARLAIDMYCYQARKYLGAYHAVLGRTDAVVFTAGIGEHAASIRAGILSGLEHLGLRLDPVANAAGGGGLTAVHAPDSAVRILVVPTDEELEIARQTAQLIEASMGARGPGR
ncbi:acetate/propionate family kinase [Candidatus Methylocalor cossyra]|uniref:Acetate kinase n=1 Tax=Candidatus Methylocalor cossyra TaxID=3108543 RepID=A0ABM9NF72_9GAMM